MRKDKKAVLIALCLGDGHLRKTRNGKGKKSENVQLALLHSTTQLSYMEWKASKLHSLLGGKRSKISIRRVWNKTVRKHYERCEVNKSHKYFKVLYRWLYPDGNKKITRRILDYLTPEAIAIWMMDDGGIKKRKNKAGQESSFQFYLATYVTEEEAKIIQKYFSDVWDIDWKVREVKGKWMHYTNTTGTKKLSTLISPYVIPSMEYKIVRPTSAQPTDMW